MFVLVPGDRLVRPARPRRSIPLGPLISQIVDVRAMSSVARRTGSCSSRRSAPRIAPASRTSSSRTARSAFASGASVSTRAPRSPTSATKASAWPIHVLGGTSKCAVGSVPANLLHYTSGQCAGPTRPDLYVPHAGLARRASEHDRDAAQPDRRVRHSWGGASRVPRVSSATAICRRMGPLADSGGTRDHRLHDLDGRPDGCELQPSSIY